ncbi:ImmA/IrrE family metallo-endopeptidase [Nocardia yamanashiensis]|uniref:ImmA/IrrE family metallo-endopeptidase n=1 Tax=Nocardia yamanashiensis TaxID=209247 RepID=UPI001E46C149|nr:ImmA/IrrE family metallo-endopeptidase [Nocardia yamanashiensis]UGT45405.1 ImmA/IrrE family metallo-endopeptidase [Nocardia yamanashiensis]
MRIAAWAGSDGEHAMMDRRGLRRELRHLGLTGRFTVTQLAAALAARRERPLRLRPERFPVAGLSGGLLVTRDIDFIAYQSDTSPLHQDHIVCHELGHLLAGHRTVTVTGQDALRLLAPNIDPAVVRRMLGRTCSSEQQEQEAEHIADLLMSHHISRWTPHAEWVLPDSVPADIRNLLDTLGPGED